MYSKLSAGLMLLAVAALVGCQVPKIRSGLPVSHNLPPAQMLAEPGPGVTGPGPGVTSLQVPAMGAGYGVAGGGGGGYGMAVPSTAQILFDQPQGMQINWDVSSIGMFDSVPLVVPGRQNFNQGGVYRLRVSNIGGREGVELYPTLEVAPMTRRTASYLSHSAIPIQFTDEDFDQVMAGNFVTKVIYVPDPEFQELALAGVDTLVSTRLDPGVDPISEADRRGSVLAIVRIGNKDLGMPGSNTDMAYGGVMGGGMGMGGGMPGGRAPDTSNFISGITGPNYGMPHVGTSIGLPGPPHIPMGGPAGLQRYGIHNHTPHAIPGPTPKVNVHVKQYPGLTYPRPADTVLINEKTIRPPHYNAQPPSDMVHGNIRDCGYCGG
ncbi:MAG: hypothetical protein ACR2NP_12750, partial [Pirellulaceae bacterium]